MTAESVVSASFRTARGRSFGHPEAGEIGQAGVRVVRTARASAEKENCSRAPLTVGRRYRPCRQVKRIQALLVMAVPVSVGIPHKIHSPPLYGGTCITIYHLSPEAAANQSRHARCREGTRGEDGYLLTSCCTPFHGGHSRSFAAEPKGGAPSSRLPTPRRPARRTPNPEPPLLWATRDFFSRVHWTQKNTPGRE